MQLQGSTPAQAGLMLNWAEARVLGVVMALGVGWLARRIAPPEQLARQIAVGFVGDTPVELDFGAEIPAVRLRLQISNPTPATLCLDRITFVLTIGQRTLHGAILDRCTVERYSTYEPVRFEQQLSLPQQEQIRKYSAGGRLRVPVQLALSAYFDSPVGPIVVEQVLERRDVRADVITG